MKTFPALLMVATSAILTFVFLKLSEPKPKPKPQPIVKPALVLENAQLHAIKNAIDQYFILAKTKSPHSERAVRAALIAELCLQNGDAVKFVAWKDLAEWHALCAEDE